MGTKNNPGRFDCYANALPDEPMFTLLARDPQFSHLVNTWATQRVYDISVGERPSSDQDLVNEARWTAEKGREWRRNNNGIWRKA